MEECVVVSCERQKWKWVLLVIEDSQSVGVCKLKIFLFFFCFLQDFEAEEERNGQWVKKEKVCEGKIGEREREREREMEYFEREKEGSKKKQSREQLNGCVPFWAFISFFQGSLSPI